MKHLATTSTLVSVEVYARYIILSVNKSGMMENEISGLFVYDGSKLLQPISDVIGLPIDQVNMTF